MSTTPPRRVMAGTVQSVEYVSTTTNGNTRHRITMDTGATFLTAPDSASGGDAQNLREHDSIEFTCDALGRVIGIHSCTRATGAQVWRFPPIQ